MTKQELNEWYKGYKQYRNGYHMSDSDWSDLVHLNHVIMEMSHNIHNDNMLNMRKKL